MEKTGILHKDGLRAHFPSVTGRVSLRRKQNVSCGFVMISLVFSNFQDGGGLGKMATTSFFYFRFQESLEETF